MLPMASRKGLSPAAARLSRRFRSPSSCNVAVLQPPGCRDSLGLGYSPFARHYWGNHCYFLFLRVLRCFSSPRWPHYRNIVIATSRWLGCPIRRPRDQGSFAPPPRLSQLTTSFVASRSQGIRHAPFPTFLFLRSACLIGSGLILPALAVWYRISCDSFTVKFNLVVNMSWSSSAGRTGWRPRPVGGE